MVNVNLTVNLVFEDVFFLSSKGIFEEEKKCTYTVIINIYSQQKIYDDILIYVILSGTLPHLCPKFENLYCNNMHVMNHTDTPLDKMLSISLASGERLHLNYNCNLH